ncbi:MAG TPA: carbohydrate-binding family 9-like protein [Pyrinomonadaceae bacterium]|jgi:Domain of unknown function (DUF1083).|nr:carbohydrate-binding family 9-like protein [Pyrinomonadaceae bacterium]
MTSFDSNSQDSVVASYVTGLTSSDLEHDAWFLCSPVFITHQWSGAAAPPERHAEVRLGWNDDGLFVRFVCSQQEPLVVAERPVTNQKTIGLWDRDVCEIFVAPDSSNPAHYFEFEAAPTGEWIDLGIQITKSGKETEWDYSSGMKTEASVAAEQIVVGMLIPWSERIRKPDRGVQWRANLFRCVGSDEATRYLAWRPTRTPEPNFHVPEAFGTLRFA